MRYNGDISYIFLVLKKYKYESHYLGINKNIFITYYILINCL